jgi:DNA mismatch endonuclease, patch repair protein
MVGIEFLKHELIAENSLSGVSVGDVFNKKKRSQVMSRIRGKGNKNTEIALMNLLKSHGITGWRRHQPVFGKPDFIFRTARVAVFVDGCFWHGCLKHYQYPSTNDEFWRRKLESNRKRDRVVTRALRSKGWTVIRIWECHLQKSPVRCINRIKKALGRVNAVDELLHE